MAKRRSIQTRNYQKKVYNYPSTPSEKKCRDALISLIVNGVLKDKEQYKSKFPKGYYESILKQYSTEHNKDWLHVTLLKNRVRMAVNKRAKALPLPPLTITSPPTTITTPTSNVPVRIYHNIQQTIPLMTMTVTLEMMEQLGMAIFAVSCGETNTD